MPSRVAVLAPMTIELRPVRRAMRDVAAVHTCQLAGVGPAAARRATERLLRDHAPDHVVVVGIAGGVDPALRVGDVVVPEVVIDRVDGTERRPARLGDMVPRGGLITTAELVLGVDDLATMLRERGIVAIDMETSAVAAVCDANGVPWSVFRSISDRPGDGTIDASTLDLLGTDGKPNWAGVARTVLTRPRSIPVLMRLGRDASTAARAAADAAAAALRT